jgi:hypothetical protein
MVGGVAKVASIRSAGTLALNLLVGTALGDFPWKIVKFIVVMSEV